MEYQKIELKDLPGEMNNIFERIKIETKNEYNSKYPNEKFLKKVQIEGIVQNNYKKFQLNNAPFFGPFFINRNFKISGKFTKIEHEIGGQLISTYYPDIMTIIGCPFNYLIIKKLPSELSNLVNVMLGNIIIEVQFLPFHNNYLKIYSSDQEFENINLFADEYTYNPDFVKSVLIYNTIKLQSNKLEVGNFLFIKYIILKVKEENLGSDLNLILDNKYKITIKCLNINSGFNIYTMNSILNFKWISFMLIEMDYTLGYLININGFRMMTGMGGLIFSQNIYD